MRSSSTSTKWYVDNLLRTSLPSLSTRRKKELVGQYKNAGRELRAQGDPEEVNVHDFVDPEQGRAAP